MEYQDCVVTVNVGAKEFSGTYPQVIKSSITTDDLLKMLSDDKTAKQLIADYHYGSDLRAKADCRAKILSTVSSDEVNFEKQVKLFMQARANNGKPVSEEKARQFVKMSLESE